MKKSIVAYSGVINSLAISSIGSEFLADQLLTTMTARIEEMKATKIQKARIMGRILKRRREANDEPSLNRLQRQYASSDSKKARQSRELRLMHVARGYLSGVPYKAMEQSLKPGNGLSPEDIVPYLGAFSDTGDIYNWMKEKFTPKITVVNQTDAAGKEIRAIEKVLSDEDFQQNAPRDRLQALQARQNDLIELLQKELELKVEPEKLGGAEIAQA